MWKRLKERTPRWLALVVIATVALGSYAIGPAIGGPPKLTVKKAKRLFYTKNQSNARYFTKDVANARFVPRQSGEHAVTLDPWDWRPGAGAPARSQGPGHVVFQDNGQNTGVELHDGSLPSEFAGKGLRLSAVEICFEVTNAEYDRLTVLRYGPPTGGDPVPDGLTFLSDDPDPNLVGSQCRRVSAPPAVIGGAGIIDLELTVDFSGAGELRIGRTTAFFVP